MKVIAFLPAKGVSERIANKNTAVLSGEKLFVHGIKKLLSCREIDEVVFDSESEQMHNEVDYLKCSHLKRDAALASNSTDGHELFLNEIKEFPDGDIYVQYLCTAPFLKPSTIDSGIKFLKENPEYDSVILMKSEKSYLWENSKPTYGDGRIPNSKDLPKTITEAMSLYIVRKETALKNRKRFGNRPYFLFGEPLEYIDINNPEDLAAAEVIAEGYKNKEVNRLRLLKHFASSSMLSDLLDEYFWNTGEKAGSVIAGLKPNISGRANVIFGRAKTLKLRSLRAGENANGIYEAYSSYSLVTTNDVIVVENPVAENAYFGDLNTRIAIRAGASGAIVSSVTRDSERVKSFNFPVYSSGQNAQDVRGRATVESINKVVKIKGVEIVPNDLIFADDDAIIVISQDKIDQILALLMSKIEMESKVSLGIVSNLSTEELLKKEGGF